MVFREIVTGIETLRRNESVCGSSRRSGYSVEPIELESHELVTAYNVQLCYSITAGVCVCVYALQETGLSPLLQ